MEGRRRCLHGLKVRQWAAERGGLEVQSRWIFFPFIIHWKLSEESEHSVLSAPSLWYKTGRMAQSPAPCRILRISFLFSTFFWGRQGGKYFHRISFQESFPDNLPDLVYFFASVLFQLSKCKCATLAKGSESSEVQCVKPRFKKGTVWQTSKFHPFLSLLTCFYPA